MTDEEWAKHEKNIRAAIEMDSQMSAEEWAAWEKELDEMFPPGDPAAFDLIQSEDATMAVFLLTVSH